jgi:C-terminal processing protease CtpA/Prc
MWTKIYLTFFLSIYCSLLLSSQNINQTRQHCLYIKPNITFPDTFKFSKLGFSFVDRNESLGALIVTGFFENSQAEISGLHIDDKIKAIDNIPVKEMDFQKLEEYINKTNKLILGVERGNELLNIEIIQSRILRNE